MESNGALMAKKAAAEKVLKKAVRKVSRTPPIAAVMALASMKTTPGKKSAVKKSHRFGYPMDRTP